MSIEFGKEGKYPHRKKIQHHAENYISTELDIENNKVVIDTTLQDIEFDTDVKMYDEYAPTNNLHVATKGYVDQNIPSITVAQTTGTSTTSVMSQNAVTDELGGKQDALVSGTNIKTINSQSLLGSGDITISGGYNYTNLVYVDSSADGTGDGTPSKPYQNPTDIVETVISFTGNTTLNNATITTIADTSVISVGDIVGGTGVAWEARVLSKTANSITLDKVCTANGTTIALKSITPKKVICTGNFTSTANWERMNIVEWDFQNSNVQIGNLTAYEITVKRIANLKMTIKANGTHANSKLYYNKIAQDTSFVEEFKVNWYGINTGRAIQSVVQGGITIFDNCIMNSVAGGNILLYYRNVSIKGGRFYSLLENVYVQYSSKLNSDAIIESPSAVNAVTTNWSTEATINGIVKGSCLFERGRITGNASIVGTTFTYNNGNQEWSSTFNGTIEVTTGTASYCTFNGNLQGSWTFTACKAYSVTANVTVNGTQNEIYITQVYTKVSGNITLNANSELTVFSRVSSVTYVTINTGAKFINMGHLIFLLNNQTLAGNIENRGTIIFSTNGNTTFSGILTNWGNIKSAIVNADTDILRLNGATIENYGLIENSRNVAFPIFNITGASTIYNYGGRFKVNNGLSPFKNTVQPNIYWHVGQVQYATTAKTGGVELDDWATGIVPNFVKKDVLSEYNV